jgi:hypothetical protein
VQSVEPTVRVKRAFHLPTTRSAALALALSALGGLSSSYQDLAKLDLLRRVYVHVSASGRVSSCEMPAEQGKENGSERAVGRQR